MNLRERPYLEVEVVEVNQKKKVEIPLVCLDCTLKEDCRKYQRLYKKLEKEGNWVNGENLDKIKFPCLCTSQHGFLGMITSGTPKQHDVYEYILHNISEQGECSATSRSDSLRRLIEAHDIHIEKAKIVIFKEI